MMLRHMNLTDHASTIEKAVLGVRPLDFVSKTSADFVHTQTIAEGQVLTGDLGGKSSTREFTDAILSRI
jgi:isocitrate dehydrogenase (NAD+)